MISVSVRDSGFERLKDLDVDELLKTMALETESGAKRLMRGSKSGRAYGGHVASAPGEAPAIDTGNLIASIQTTPISNGYEVSVGAAYAAALEYGTGRMAARPFIRPALFGMLSRLDPVIVDLLEVT